MKNLKQASKRTIALLAAAAVMLVSGSVLGTRAAINIISENYDANMNMASNAVALIENDNPVEEGKLTLGALGEKDESGKQVAIIPGKVYTEEIKAQNTTKAPYATPEYVRIIIHKYWKDAEGKNIEFDPALIKIELANQGSWIKSASETTAEREVYYYNAVLAAGATTPALTSGISIDGSILTKGNETSKTEGNRTVYTYEYEYNGYSVGIEAEAQSIQTHDAEKAIKSVWGVDATIDGGGNITAIK